MNKVAWFDDIVSFSLAWKTIKHREVKNFFYDPSTKRIQTHIIDYEEKRINAFSLFESTIEPKWEDPINKHGGEYRIDFSVTDIDTVQKVWEKLVFQTITAEFAESDLLAGIRLVDKSSSNYANTFRIEVWTKFGDRET